MQRAFLLMFVLFCAACSQSQTEQMVKIENGWVREVPAVSKNSAAYFELTNNMAEDDVLLSMQSDSAKVVEFHQTITEASGAKRMEPMDELVLKAKSTMQMKPGGFHVMLIGLHKPLQAGDSVNLQLSFKTAGTVAVTLPVKTTMADDMADHSSMEHHSSHDSSMHHDQHH